jgi:hypothetical protein
MGRFTLHKGGKPVQVLAAKELERLSKAGEIEWPTITKEEIADRSKGDYLSKTIVLFQMTWFIGQCIARGAYGLTVTELEMVTVAFASLAGVIYYLWWDKPIDVRCSIPVHLLEGRLVKIERDIEKEETGSPIIPSPRISAPEIDENVVINPNPVPTTSIQVDTSSPDPALTRMQRFRAFRRGACEEYGTLLGLVYVFIGFPLKRFFGAFGEMADCTTLADKSLRVPTFYSSRNDDDEYDVIPFRLAACVATAFGAIHCIAWFFHFATLQVVSGLPISIPAFSWLLPEENLGMTLHWFVTGFIMGAMMCLYLTSRIALLILPFVALRALPPGAYVELNWVSFLPHK